MSDDSLQNSPEINALKAAETGQYYNVAYEIENFLAIASDPETGLGPKYMNDGKVNGFKIFFHFDATAGLLADQANMNSALAYLLRIGQSDRYALLHKFINILSIVNSQTPWMFQEIEAGLKELWTSPFNNVLKDQIVSIKCLETIDDKIQGLMQIYRQIVWDESRDVWIVPINLRQFSMSIYVYDYRYFAEDSVASKFLQTQLNNDVRNFNHTLFDLGFCEFSHESASEAFDNVSNNANDFVTSSLHIQTKQVEISGLQKTLFGMKHSSKQMTENFYKAALGGGSSTNIVPSDITDFDAWKESLTQYLLKKRDQNGWYQTAKEKYAFLTDPKTWKRELGNVIETGINKIEDRVDNAIAGLYMGNVYGFSLQDIIRAGDSGSVFNDVQQAIRKNSQIQSMTLDDDTKQKQGQLGNDSNADLSLSLDDDTKQKLFNLGKS